MLIIHTIQGQEMSWHVGSMVPLTTTEIAHNVDFIQAEGDELEHIRRKFGTAAMIPEGKRVVKYFGDLARFIVGNL